MQNYLRGPGQGHTPVCIRYRARKAHQDAPKGKGLRKGGGHDNGKPNKGKYRRGNVSQPSASTVSDAIT